ncbi:MAG: hypothetical protein NTX37_04680 [Burkholderiales bacterium]|nr:hypothetical protein [Burkholderiales bacterium]
MSAIDDAIAVKDFNRATTLSYTCLEGLYKTYVRKHVPDQAGLTDLLPLCRVVKDDISKKLGAQGPFPVEIVNVMSTLTNAIANSRNSFSESYFAGDSEKWLALFARDLTNSIGRFLLNFCSQGRVTMEMHSLVEWTLHQAFYIQFMLFNTAYVFRSCGISEEVIKKISDQEIYPQTKKDILLDCLQNLVAATMPSNYLHLARISARLSFLAYAINFFSKSKTVVA